MKLKEITKYKDVLLKQKYQYLFFIFIWTATVVYLSYNILYEANWIFGDNLELWKTTASGNWKSLSHQIIPHLTRFNPLAFYDYNLLLFTPFYNQAISYYIYIALTFFIFSTCFIILLKKITTEFSFTWALLIGLLFFIAFIFNYGSMVLFLDVIYPDRMVLVAFSVFTLSYYMAIKKDSTTLYLIALLFAVMSTYNKEPVFGVFIVIALVNFLFYKTILSKKHKIFNILLLLNGLVFFSLFYFLVYSINTGSYLEIKQKLGFLPSFIKQISENRIIACSIILAFFRAYFLLYKEKNSQNLFYDVTLFSGLAYSMAFVLLQLPTFYFVIPAYFLMIPSLIYWTLRSYSIKNYLPLFISFMLIISFNVSYYDLKNIIAHIHYRRQNEFIHLEDFAQKYKEGYKLIFIEEPLHKDNVNSTLRNYHKDIAMLAFNFILNEDKSSDDYFLYDDVLTESEFDDKTIVFYSDFNLVDSKKRMNAITEETLKNSSKITTLLSLSVYCTNISRIKNTTRKFSSFTVQEFAIENFLFKNWSSQEDWGRWTDGEKASLTMKVSPDVKGVKLSLAHMFIPPNGELDLTVLVNGIEVSSHKYTQLIPEIDIPLPQEVINNLEKDNVINIELQMPNAKSPKELGQSEDSRKLGIGLKEISIY